MAPSDRTRNDLTDEEKQLILEIALQLPVAIWAASGAERDFSIQLWSPGAEKMYGIAREQAIGQNYLELFVNELERKQAIADHKRTIETGKPYRNLARDKLEDKDGVILTMGFRLWDPRITDYVQAEMAVDVTDVPGQESMWLDKVRQLAFQERELSARTLLLERLNNSHLAVGSMTDDSTLTELLTLIFASARELLPEIMCLRVWYMTADDEMILLSSSGKAYGGHNYDEVAIRDWVRDSGDEIHVHYESGGVNRAPSAQFTAKSVPRHVKSRPAKLTNSWAPFCAMPLKIRDDVVGVCLAYFVDDFNFERTEVVSALKSFVLQASYAVAEAIRVRADKEKNALIAEQQERVTRARISAEYTHAMAKRADALRWICELLRQEVPGLQSKSTEIEHYIALIENVSNEITRSAEGLEKAVDPSVFDLADVIEGLTNRFELQYPKVSLQRHLEQGALVHGVRVFIEGAVENLLFNAVEAVNQAGHLLVKMRARPRSRTSMYKVELLVCDSGKGLPMPLERLCEPGMSTKGAGHGFGLARARQVIFESGGTLSEVRVDGWAGACIRVTLPLVRRR